MTLSRQEVEHVALLARLGITEADTETFSAQLSVILENIEILNQADVSQVSPAAHVLPLQNVMRPDAPQPSFPVEAMLANAPAQEDNCLKVRAVLE